MALNAKIDSVIASVYSQKQSNGEWYPIIYYLKTIVNAKQKYLIYNKEILAVTAGCLTGMDFGRTSVDRSRLFRLCIQVVTASLPS